MSPTLRSIDDCVKDLMKATNKLLSLVMMTHYHADHISGFVSNYDDFADFKIGAVLSDGIRRPAAARMVVGSSGRTT